MYYGVIRLSDPEPGLVRGLQERQQSKSKLLVNDKFIFALVFECVKAYVQPEIVFDADVQGGICPV